MERLIVCPMTSTTLNNESKSRQNQLCKGEIVRRFDCILNSYLHRDQSITSAGVNFKEPVFYMNEKTLNKLFFIQIGFSLKEGLLLSCVSSFIR